MTQAFPPPPLEMPPQQLSASREELGDLREPCLVTQESKEPLTHRNLAPMKLMTAPFRRAPPRRRCLETGERPHGHPRQSSLL